MSIISDVLTDLRKLDQGPSVMRKFGLVLGIVLFLLSAMLCFKHRNDTFLTPGIISFWVGGGLSFLLAFIAPSVLKPLNTVMVFLGMIIGWVMTRIILSFLFFLVFLPTGIVMRLIGRDSMNRKLNPGQDTYWIKRPDVPFDPRQCRRLF